MAKLKCYFALIHNVSILAIIAELNSKQAARSSGGPHSRPSRKSSGNGTTPAKKAPRKKKNQDQVVHPYPPKNNKEATIPIIKEGAGPKALQKYFADLEHIDPGFKSTSDAALPDGYFARSFFFPSKDSLLSVLYSATKTIDICVFAFTDDDVADALIAAKKRGVAIKIIMDKQQAAGKGANAKRLQESYGIPFKTDNTYRTACKFI
ncbi:hypothetical protein V8B55DRAFT_1559481 [Mucor lusitanicus]